jgi:hypothetical protein
MVAAPVSVNLVMIVMMFSLIASSYRTPRTQTFLAISAGNGLVGVQAAARAVARSGASAVLQATTWSSSVSRAATL